MIAAIIYLLAIVSAETITAVFQPELGMICHAIVLVAVVTHSALTSDTSYQGLFLSLALAPLVRIISMSIPLINISQIWWYPIVYAPLLLAAVVVMRILGFRKLDIGLRFSPILTQLAISLSGFLFGLAEYFILRPQSLIDELTWPKLWWPALILLLSTGMVEEFIFRGVMQRTALIVFGSWGIIYVSFLFAILHMGFLSIIDVVFVFAVALFFGWIVKKTGSL
ncbi:MAG: CPBP family intramembrane metalloprotease, partial [Dehalococcoidales bacterium]|nr:CPBP family intramembrane metalloprotease [Dehalococcoidales bacterium]